MAMALRFAAFFVYWPWRLTRLHVYGSLLLGSRQGVLTAYLDEGKKRFDSKQSSFIFLYFPCKTKDHSFPQTRRFCKYVQNQSEGMHTQVSEVFAHESGLGF